MTSDDSDRGGRHAGARVAVWHSRGTVLATALAMGFVVSGYEREAAACGACFASQSESTVVSDHRMALTISKDHTILWDQISYSGNPKEFAYVIPARPGTRLEPSKEAWFAALDASTRPIIMSPQKSGYGGGGGGGGGGGNYGYDGTGGGGGGGGGCCSGSVYSEDGAENAGSRDGNGSPSASAADAGAGGFAPPPDPVTIVEQNVVGPYETVTLRANEPGALQKWLTANGYAIPDIAGPIIESYVAEDMDFIALRLRPGQDVRAMEPIRIVSPGADPSLPLRLMQIGAGANVGITLWVVSEGRYHPANFPDAPIDFEKLIWDYAQSRSNYQELSKQAMATGEGRGFITEYANRQQLAVTGAVPQSGMLGNPLLADAYATTCKTDPKQPPWQEAEAGVKDAGVPEGGVDPDPDPADAGAMDAGGDGGPIVHQPPPWSPKQCDDFAVATGELHPSDVWVTRLRANLPRQALAATLVLEASVDQTPFENVHYARANGTIVPGARMAHTGPTGRHGTYALTAVTALLVSRLLRRRRRHEGQPPR